MDFLVEMGVNNIVESELWYTSSDDRSLDFIRNMAEYFEPILGQLIFEPKFVSWNCSNCDSEFKQDNCISDGKYCAMMHNPNMNFIGKEILFEDLRQYCIFTMSRESGDFISKDSSN